MGFGSGALGDPVGGGGAAPVLGGSLFGAGRLAMGGSGSGPAPGLGSGGGGGTASKGASPGAVEDPNPVIDAVGPGGDAQMENINSMLSFLD